MPTRLMLVDDHKILREALRSSLEKERDIVVVAETDDAARVIELVRLHQPEIVIMDIGLAQVSGIDVTRELLKAVPDVMVIALSTFSEKKIVQQMLNAGARGYVVKAAGRDELLRAIRSVKQGKTYLCPEISGKFAVTSRAKTEN